MPSGVATSTVIGNALGAPSATVNVAMESPALPSGSDTSFTMRPGVASSFRIVPKPGSIPIVAPTAFDRCSVNVSPSSNVVSPWTSTSTVFAV